MAGLLGSACSPGSAPEQADRGPAATRVATDSLVEQSGQDWVPRALPGGAATVVEFSPLSERSSDALSQPFGNLSAEERLQFVVGNSFFTTAWVSAGASVAGRDGLGPLFNAAACQDCHIRDGRGRPPQSEEEPINAAVVRIALADGSPDPVYGNQIQTRSLPSLPAEARVRVRWLPETYRLPDGETIALRRPELQLDRWGYGSPAEGLRAGLRIAPPMTGLGLLEAIPAAAIQAQTQQPGATGQLQILAQRAGWEDPPLGRFGWKASKATVAEQSLDAFVNDLGITSSRFPVDACTPPQRQLGCDELPHGGTPELEPGIETAVLVYARHLAPPARRNIAQPAIAAGRALFESIGCQSCHRARWETGVSSDSPASSRQIIWPYTDLLLHDMGPGLADGLIEGQASGQHWRTPPLWGLGQVKTVGGEQAGYLHDGRARTLAEAIVWHGGEAQPARDAWAALPKAQRRQVLAFLNSL